MPYHLVVKRGAGIPDTLELIKKAVNVYYKSDFVKALTAQLNPTGNKYDFIKRLFDYVCSHVRYQLDPIGDEMVWTPEKTCREGVGDCKKMTVLIASVLKCAGIEPVLKHVTYAHEKHTHIYVIVPFPTINKYLTVDPVNNCKWNEEVKYSSASLNFLNGKKMDLHMMGAKQPLPGQRYSFNSDGFYDATSGIMDDIQGIGCGVSGSNTDVVLADALTSDFGMSGIGFDYDIVQGIGKRAKKSKSERKERRKDLFHKFKAVNLAASRGPFLMLVRMNIFKLANRMAKAWVHDPEPLKKMWYNMGGDVNKLRDTIKKGAKGSIKSEIHGIGCSNNQANAIDVAGMGWLTAEQIEGIDDSIGFPPAIAAGIAAATPILIKVLQIVGKSKADQQTEVPPEDQEGAPDQEPAEETQGMGKADYSALIEAGAGAATRIMQNRRAKKSGSGGGSRKSKITHKDVQALSAMVDYGTQKVLDGSVNLQSNSNMPAPDSSGTPNAPKSLAPGTNPATAVLASTNVPSPTAGSFGLQAINSLPSFIAWLKGCLVLLLMAPLGSSSLGFTIFINSVVLISFVWLTRKGIARVYSNLKKFTHEI